MRAPEARSTKKGRPPTPRKARTGLLTPPGMTRCAAANSASDRFMGLPSSRGASLRGGSCPKLPELDRQEVAPLAIPAKGSGRCDPAAHDRHDHVRRVRIRGLAAEERVAFVR